MISSKMPSPTWSYEEGALTVSHLGKIVWLGRYATRELAVKAAALYFAKHEERDAAPIVSTP